MTLTMENFEDLLKVLARLLTYARVQPPPEHLSAISRAIHRMEYKTSSNTGQAYIAGLVPLGVLVFLPQEHFYLSHLTPRTEKLHVKHPLTQCKRPYPGSCKRV